EILERSQKVVENMKHRHMHGGPRGLGDFADFGWMLRGRGPFGPLFGPGPGPRPPWARGQGGPWGRAAKARKGNVRAAILVLLAEEPRNGYQIIQEINERSGGA